MTTEAKKATPERALGIVDRLLRAAEGFAGTTITVQDLQQIRSVIIDVVIAKDKPAYQGVMDPGCYYAKSCGFDPGSCPVCKDRRQTPADGIYYGDEIGQLEPEEEEL